MHIPLHVFLKIFLSKPTDIHTKQNQGGDLAQHLQALRFCLEVSLNSRTGVSISSDPPVLFILCQQRCCQRKGEWWWIWYTMCAVREIWVVARAACTWCDVIIIRAVYIYYIHANVILLMYVCIAYVIEWYSAVWLDALVVQYILLHNSSYN